MLVKTDMTKKSVAACGHHLTEKLSVSLLEFGLRFGLFRVRVRLRQYRRAGCSRDSSPSQAHHRDLQLAAAHPDHDADNDPLMKSMMMMLLLL